MQCIQASSTVGDRAMMVRFVIQHSDVAVVQCQTNIGYEAGTGVLCNKNIASIDMQQLGQDSHRGYERLDVLRP